MFRVGESFTASNTLSLEDKISGTTYLVDTGADVSVYPASRTVKNTTKTDSPLVAANGTKISTWGKREVTIKINENMSLKHQFHIAEVTQPILGADFFTHNNLVIDLRQKRLITKSGEQIKLKHSRNTLTLAGLSQNEPSDYTQLLGKFPELLTPSFDSATNKHGVEHMIVTEGPPTHARARRLDAEKLRLAREEFLHMEELGIVRRSKSPWASPLHMVPKADGKWRPCGDYRQLNNQTRDDRYPLPHIQDFNNHLTGCTFFSKIDLIRGYHQIPVEDASISKTAVITPFGLWEFLRTPFGLKNAAQSFQRLIDGVLRDIPFSFAYIDDILIASKSKEEHLKHLESLFNLLSQNGLVINKSKCVFGVKELDFLGHHINQDGISPLQNRIADLQKFQRPSNRKELQRFLGIINYYHRFLPHIADTLAPLHKQASGKGQHIEWSDECQQAFDSAKSKLGQAILLHHPRPNAPTRLTVDASNTGIGGQVEQLHGRTWVPLAFFSRKLSETEKKYSTFDRELLAAYNAIKHFKHLLEGRKFALFTDHKPLTFAMTCKTDRSPRQTRHLSYIAEFTSDVRHISGASNIMADALSRIETVQPTQGDNHNTQANNSFPETQSQKLATDQRDCPDIKHYLASHPNTGLKLETIKMEETDIICDTSTGRPRPMLPKTWRRTIFDQLHNLSHASARPTLEAITKRYVWHGMKKDIRQWCRECHPCQASKIHRHTKAPLTERQPPTGRFRSLHVDLVGPLPTSHGNTYLFTIIDRFTRWPEAIPLPDALASSCASALIQHWISRFGVPEDITSDRGAQFTSTLWKEVNMLLGTAIHNTTAYHPQANGMVERLHRQLKASLKARMTTADWMMELPHVLLGIRTSWRVEPDCSPAELVYGSTLRLPGEMIQTSDPRATQPTTVFARSLQGAMQRATPTVPQYHGNHPNQVPTDLAKTGFVYLRHGGTRHPLQRPYDGPFKIIKCQDKYFVIDKNGRTEKVSIDRLKSAHVTWLTDTTTNHPTNATQKRKTPRPQQQTPRETKDESHPNTPPQPLQQTRAGRKITLPPRFRR